MKEKEKAKEQEKEQRGVITLPNIPGVMPQFTRVAKQHAFRVANNTDKKVRDLITNAKTPLKENNSCVVYNIPCKCGKYSYTGETDRKFETRKKEHQDKVRLTREDMENEKYDRADNRMNSGGGGLARHVTQEIDLEKGKIIG